MDPREQFIERLGLFTEQDGFPRIAGRIFGLLLLAPDAYSLDEIADRLGVSKASVSTDARRLDQLGIIERVSRPGDRRDYYSVTPALHERFMEMRLQRLRRFIAILEEGRDVPGQEPQVRERIEDFIDLFQHCLQVWDRTLAERRSSVDVGVASTGGDS